MFDYLRKLHTSEDSARLIGEIFAFAHQHLSLRPSAAIMYAAPQEQSDYLRMKLHRPLRACGMVRNLGDAGGGPFWVEYPDGSQSLQAVWRIGIPSLSRYRGPCSIRSKRFSIYCAKNIKRDEGCSHPLQSLGLERMTGSPRSERQSFREAEVCDYG